MACKCESFEGTESSIEFVDAAFEGVFGRNAGFSSEVDEGEEEVADFITKYGLEKRYTSLEEMAKNIDKCNLTWYNAYK